MQIDERAAPATVGVPEGWKLIAVNPEFDNLMYWLERCYEKGHMDRCSDLIEPWIVFDYDSKTNFQAAANPVAQEDVLDAINWIDDFVARCNGDDRGSCDSVNLIRAALAAIPAAAPVVLPEPVSDKDIDAAVYAQCPDFDAAHEGPSIDDMRAIVRALLATATRSPAEEPTE